MDLTTRTWLVIALGGVATYGSRVSFLLLARRLAEVPDRARDMLRMIPAAALAALVAPALLRPETTWQPLGPQALSGALALAVAWWTRSLLATMAVGIVAVMGLEAVLG